MSERFPESYTVAVVGAGVIGLACARALLARGAKVRVLEAGRAGHGATWAAAGMLAPAGEAAEGETLDAQLTAFGMESLDLWPAWAGAVEAESGRDVGFAATGSVIVATTAEEAARLERLLKSAERLGLVLEGCDLREIKTRIPVLSDRVKAVLVAPRDAVVDARKLADALVASVTSLGGEIEEGAEVLDVESAGGARVRVRSGTVTRSLDADLIVLAPGWRAGALKGRWPSLGEIVPVKGQSLRVGDLGSVNLTTVIRGAGVYVAPRADGTVVVGATVEPGRSDADVCEDAVAKLHRAAAALIPALGDAPVVETWSGVRPGRAGGAGPLLGRLEPSVLVAAGHYRNGVLLAPATAERICELALEAAG